LLTALVEFVGGSNEEVGKVRPGFGSIEDKSSVRSAGIALVDLEISELPS